MKNLSNENIVHVIKEDIQYLQFKKLLEYKDKINHCYTLKESYEINDGENYEKLFNELGLKYDGLKRIKYQAHSDIVEVVNDEIEHTNIDGLVSDKIGITLSLRFADCTPIYMYDPTKNIIGDIHSGWKGTVQKIGQKAVLKMIQEYDCNLQDIICCIGPCICEKHFEVHQDVKDIFEETFSYFENINEMIRKGIVEEGKQKYNINLTKINIKLLEDAGIKRENIIDSKTCTACNSDIMHSYRMDREKAGRNTAIIGLI